MPQDPEPLELMIEVVSELKDLALDDSDIRALLESALEALQE